MVCRLSASGVALGRMGFGACAARYLPARTATSLEYLSPYGWRVLARGLTARTGVVPFGFRFSRAGYYRLRVVTSLNRVYGVTASPTMMVRIR
jgi:hypothetical protein